MAHAYTPGLKVTPNIEVRKTRRLPLRGEVLVKEGDEVTHDAIVARTDIPGDAMLVNVANMLGVEASDVPHYMMKQVGEQVEEDEIIAQFSSFFGLFKARAKSNTTGTIESISEITGQITVRTAPVPVEVHAYIDGRVVEVIPEQGVVIENRGAYIQGIFGVGGERQGALTVVVDGPDDPLDADRISKEHKGCIVVGGSLVTAEALKRADEVGVSAVVAGGIIDRDLVELLNYDIGVAITGHEDISFSVIITEGFGRMGMAHKTFELLKTLEGQMASVNGATQIRAGVMRPEIIVPGVEDVGIEAEDLSGEGMVPGTPIRIIREPYFGRLAEVAELPAELVKVETEAPVRILRAKLIDTGEIVTVPRANVEIIEG